MRASDWTALAAAVAFFSAIWMMIRAIYRFLVGMRDNTNAILALTREMRELRKWQQSIDDWRMQTNHRLDRAEGRPGRRG